MVNVFGFLSMGIALLSLFVSPCYSLENGKGNDFDSTVTLQFQDELMCDVLAKVSFQSGISIMYDEKYSSDKVSGIFENTSLEEVVARLFSGVNKILTVMEQEKVLIVETYGAQKYALASAGPTALAGSGRSVFGGMTVQQVKDLHRTQYGEYKKKFADMAQLVPGLGMTRGELLELHRKQSDAYKNDVSHADQISPGSDKTYEELRALHEKQYKDYLDSQSDTDEIQGMGVSHNELRTLHEKQYTKYKKELENEDEFIPEVGMTRKQLLKLHESQYNASRQ